MLVGCRRGCGAALGRAGRVSCSRLLRLILRHKSISLPTHAFARLVTTRASIKIGVAKGDVGLALLEQCLVIHDSPAIGSNPRHFELT